MSFFYDVSSDVVEVIRLRADGAMARGALAEIIAPDEAGEVLGAKAPVDESGVDRLVVAMHDLDDDEIGLFAVRGPCDLAVAALTVAVYRGLKCHDAAVADAGHAAVVSGTEAANDFAVVLSAIAATDVFARIYLIGEPVTKTT